MIARILARSRVARPQTDVRLRLSDHLLDLVQSPRPVTLGILYPSRKMLPPRTKAFIDLASEALKKHVAGELGVLEVAKRP